MLFYAQLIFIQKDQWEHAHDKTTNASDYNLMLRNR